MIANTKMNAKIYGDDILQSEDNGILLCNYCHDHHSIMDVVKKQKEKLLIKINKN